MRFCEMRENGGKTIVDKKWSPLPQRDASQQLALATARLLLPQGALLRNIRRAGAGIIPRVAKEVDPAAREKGISREAAETNTAVSDATTSVHATNGVNSPRRHIVYAIW